MNIGFYVEDEEYFDMARMLVRSAKEHMPDVPIYQLTREKVRAPCEAIRIPGDMPMGVRRLKHYASLEGNWLFLDVDVLFQRDVRHVFDLPFDVAFASREGTFLENHDYAKVMPYNFGVVFSKNPAYWQMLIPHLLELSPELQEWGGEQYLAGQLANQALSCFSVEILPSAYNFTPVRRDDDFRHAAIVHYKGKRKAWILSTMHQ